MNDRDERLKEIERDLADFPKHDAESTANAMAGHVRWLLSEVRTLAEQREELEIAFDAVKFACEVEREAKNAANGALTASQQREAALQLAALRLWQPAHTAPTTGEHILVASLGNQGFGICGGKWQDFMAVVHYWANPGEEGFYLSAGASAEIDDHPVRFTHWQPLVSDLPNYADVSAAARVPDAETARPETAVTPAQGEQP